MAEATKAQKAKLYASNVKKRRVDSEGRPCPPNTYIRESKYGPVWYAKITIGGKQIELNSKILERDRCSREAIVTWVEKEYARRVETYEAELRNEFIMHGDLENEFAPNQSRTTVGSVCKLEIESQRDAHPGSSYIDTVILQLTRIGDFFHPEREVETITMRDTDAYIAYRRTCITNKNKRPSDETIYREIASFQRAIKCANNYELFRRDGQSYVFILPLNMSKRKKAKNNHRVDLKAKSKQFTYAECQEWIRAARGTHLEHYAYMAFHTGMRSEELKKLCWSWVHKVDDGDCYAVINLPSELYMDSDVDGRPVVLMEQEYLYLERLAQGKGKDEPLLKKMTGLSQWMRKVAENTQAKDSHGDPLYIHLRSLRASYGRWVLEQTGDMFLVQTAMRHKDIQTTQKFYVNPQASDRKKVAKALGASRQLGTKKRD